MRQIRRKLPGEVIFCAVNIALPLLAGAYIYIKVSPDSYLGCFVRILLPLADTGAAQQVPLFWRWWGGDFLWAYAFFFALYLNARHQKNGLRQAVLLASVCAIFVEVLQLIQVDFLKCGTFDIWDIVIELFAVYFGALLLRLFRYINKKKREKNE